jgi:hypothetical protein
MLFSEFLEYLPVDRLGLYRLQKMTELDFSKANNNFAALDSDQYSGFLDRLLECSNLKRFNVRNCNLTALTNEQIQSLAVVLLDVGCDLIDGSTIVESDDDRLLNAINEKRNSSDAGFHSEEYEEYDSDDNVDSEGDSDDNFDDSDNKVLKISSDGLVDANISPLSFTSMNNSASLSLSSVGDGTYPIHIPSNLFSLFGITSSSSSSSTASTDDLKMSSEEINNNVDEKNNNSYGGGF